MFLHMVSLNRKTAALRSERSTRSKNLLLPRKTLFDQPGIHSLTQNSASFKFRLSFPTLESTPVNNQKVLVEAPKKPKLIVRSKPVKSTKPPSPVVQQINNFCKLPTENFNDCVRSLSPIHSLRVDVSPRHSSPSYEIFMISQLHGKPRLRSIVSQLEKQNLRKSLPKSGVENTLTSERNSCRFFPKRQLLFVERRMGRDISSMWMALIEKILSSNEFFENIHSRGYYYTKGLPQRKTDQPFSIVEFADRVRHDINLGYIELEHEERSVEEFPAYLHTAQSEGDK